MSKEKQIEEMRDFMLAKSNSANVEPVFTTSEGQEIVLGKDLTKLLNNVLEQAFIPFLAEALYNAGYRKQSEGEWVAHSWQYECSVCKNCIEFQDLMATDYDPIADLDYKYCPYCGAKMKGGAE
jgi:hypothetical protein